MEKEDYELIDNREAGRYEYRIGNLRPHIEYKVNREGDIFLTHTDIPQELRGRGVGSRLVEDTLRDIDRKNMKVIPLCGFVAGYMKKKPGWMRLLKEGMQIG